MDSNAFGKLIRAHRQAREWKQEELAKRWGFTREYVSQIERGKRKLDKPEHLKRLVAILGISEAELAEVGRGRQSKQLSVQSGEPHTDVLLEALLEPAHATVKLSALLSQEVGLLHQAHDLHDVWLHLKGALSSYRGQFRKPALHLLCTVHEHLGWQAIDRTATQEAFAEFQAMYDLAEELGDTTLLTLAMIEQSTMFRRTARFELAFRRMEAAEKRAHHAPLWVQGYLWKFAARNFAFYGDEQSFLRCIDRADRCAANGDATPNVIVHNFSPLSVLQERALGYTLLWQPEKALSIYQQIDSMHPFPTLREQSARSIAKACAHCYNGDLQIGIEHGRIGLRIAHLLQSAHYVLRLQQMCERLSVTTIGKEQTLRDLHSEILAIRYKLCGHTNGW